MFATTFFFAETLNPGRLQDFILEPGITLAKGEDANWAYWRLPERLTAKLIQDLTHFERNLSVRDDRRHDRAILPFVSFDFGAEGRRDRHLEEFFVESWNALAGEHTNTSTEVAWDAGTARVSWNFAKEPRDVTGRTYHWRNIWGWCLKRFPARAAPSAVPHLPLPDNFERYPEEKVIRQAAEQGGNVFILHENWRLDMANGEMPYDPRRLRQTIELCHQHGFRVGLYVRGNEDAIRKSFAEPLRPYLQRDWDGIYMDYGSPGHLLEP